MIIGIDASRAFVEKRTGIEEYSYQVIKNLRKYLKDTQVVLYIKCGQKIDFKIPKKWRVRSLWMPFLWTQFRLSLEILIHSVDILFVPAHVVPIIHPKKTIVTIHGLEYEFCPEAYSAWEKIYMRWSIKNSCQWADKIITVSKNSKKDICKIYNISEDKIRIVYEGYDSEGIISSSEKEDHNDIGLYLFFVGRLEERKNVVRIIESFEKFKGRKSTSHKLVLAGLPGYGYEKISKKIINSKYKSEIILMGFVENKKRIGLMKNASIFMFPTLYEGFGLPVIEAQALGVPVITSKISSLPEISGKGALLVDPRKTDEITEAIEKIIFDSQMKDDIIAMGKENCLRFSWDKCAERISKIISEQVNI